MRKKQLLLVVMAFMLLMPSFLMSAETNHVEAEKMDGQLSSKDEVVYATLQANGALKEIYVVNTLDILKPGTILDYGEYSSVKNLTDLSVLDQDDQTVQIDAPEGKFYYQGNLKDDRQLPWDISISFLVDGQEVAPTELAGKSGHIEINIQTSANKQVDEVFFENYLLQVSLMLPNSYGNIDAKGGMIANAGENKQITFTVMPGKEEILSVEADADNFEFQGIEIAAVPSTLPIDTSEMDTMTEDMSSLTNAIGELNDGVADLKTGVSELNNGVSTLRNGSEQYKSGINEVAGSSSGLVDASLSIGQALTKISTSLTSDSSEMDVSKLNELPDGLTDIANGLMDTADGLSTLQKNYGLSYRALEDAIEAIPDNQLTEEQVSELYKSGADTDVLDNVLATYSAALTVKGTYSKVKEAFAAVEPSLLQASEAVKKISMTLTSIANEFSDSLEEMDFSALEQLQEGLATLSSNYGEFHSGLVSYSDGVGKLSTSYNELHSGITTLNGGTSELATGVGTLHNGTNELFEETSDLPEQMQEKMNQMISEYDKSDFKPVSFVSPKNEKIHSLQFVIKTETIQLAEQEMEKEEVIQEKGFWELFLDLFK